MGQIKGWMLKQKTDTDTVWENRGVPKYNKTYHRTIHVGHGTVLFAEKKKDLWICSRQTSGDKEVIIAKDPSRTKVENKCRVFMKKHPYGVRSRSK